MEKTIAAAEANRNFSRILREVGAGDSFTVTSHGRPVARIVPAGAVDREAAKQRLLQCLAEVKPMNLGKFNREDAYD